MYHRRHFLFRGFGWFFGVILLMAILFGISRMGMMSRGMMTTGPAAEMAMQRPGMDTSTMLIFFGGIMGIMIVGFVLKFVFWKLIGEKRFEQFAEMRKEFPNRAYYRDCHPPRHYWHHGYHEDDFERPARSAEESPRTEED